MKKSLIKIMALLSAVTVLATTGCSSSGEESVGSQESVITSESESVKESVSESESKAEESTTEEGEVAFWSTYGTTKVIQSSARNDGYVQDAPAFDISMMQGEYESAQLIITSDHTAEYDIQIGDLKNSNGDKIPKENIAVYHQKYIEIYRNYHGNDAFKAGDEIPDMLLPFDIAKEYGENKVEKDCNQGITLEINSEGLTAGEYKGTAKVKVGSAETDVPVSVTVWDFGFDSRRRLQSSFLIFRDQLGYGEYDNTKTVLDNYTDVLLRYKVDAYSVRDIYEEERFYESIERFKDLNMASIIIPTDFELGYQAVPSNANYQEAVKYIVYLAKNSTSDLIYTDYAYFYPSTYDEEDADAAKAEAASRFYKTGGEYENTLKGACEALKKDGEFTSKPVELQNAILESIMKIPAVLTITSAEGTMEWMRGDTPWTTYCPMIDTYNNYVYVEKLQSVANEKANGNLWVYSCVIPNDPYPTLHIDDKAVRMRANGWMDKAFNITGYLYYEVDWYGNDDAYIDVYKDPIRAGGPANGDGYLLYPGKYYGSEYPFATVRLASYRDGMDDYDMLCVYEDLLNAKAQKYGLDKIDVNDYVQDLYNMIFMNTTVVEDESKLYEARKLLAERIMQLKSSEVFFFADGENVNAYADVATLTVNGKNVNGVTAGEGYKFALEDESGKFEIVQGGKTYLYETRKARTFSAEDVTLSANSVKSGNTVTIKTVGGGNWNKPTIKFAVSGLSDVHEIRFAYENTSANELEAEVRILYASGYKIIKADWCDANKTSEVRLNLENVDIDWANVVSVDIVFNKYVDGTEIKLGDMQID